MTRGVSTPRPGLRAAVLWTGAGNAAYAASQYLLLMALAKLATPHAVGQFTLAQAIVAPVIAVSQMQLRQVQVTDVRGEARPADYLGVRLVATGVALLCLTALALGLRWGAFGVVLAWVAVGKGAESLSDSVYGALQRRDRLDLVSRLLAGRGLVAIATFAAVLAVSRSLVAATATLAIACLGALLAWEVPTMLRAGVAIDRPNGARMRAVARAAAPLAVAAGLVAASSNLPRYVLDALAGKTAVAVFSVALAPVALMGLFTGALSQATLARAASAFQHGDRRAFARIVALLTGVNVTVGVACVAAFTLVSDELVGLLFTPEYVAAAPVMTVMALGVALGGLSAFGSTVLLASRRFDLQLYNIVVGLLVQIPVCYWLIGRYGAVGAAWSELVRSVVCTAYLTLAGFLEYRRRMHRSAPVAPPAVVVVPPPLSVTPMEPVR